MLPLLTVAGSLQSGLRSLETNLKQQIVNLKGLLGKQSGPPSSLIRLRLGHAGVRIQIHTKQWLHIPFDMPVVGNKCLEMRCLLSSGGAPEGNSSPYMHCSSLRAQVQLKMLPS